MTWSDLSMFARGLLLCCHTEWLGLAVLAVLKGFLVSIAAWRLWRLSDLWRSGLGLDSPHLTTLTGTRATCTLSPLSSQHSSGQYFDLAANIFAGQIFILRSRLHLILRLTQTFTWQRNKDWFVSSYRNLVIIMEVARSVHGVRGRGVRGSGH